MGAISPARKVRIRRRAAAASLSALALAGVMGSGVTAAQARDQLAADPAGTGCPASIPANGTVSVASWYAAPAGVPWRSVGRGWILADLAKSASATGRETLYLTSPRGQRYRLGRTPANATLEDWSGNGTNALFFAQGDNSTRASITVLNLHDGKASSFTVFSGAPFPGISFSRPSGEAVLFLGPASEEGGFLPLQRFSLTGAREQCYPTTFPRAGAVDGGFVETPDGTEIVMSTDNGMEVVSNAGQPIRALAIHATGSCQQLNLWNSQSVLATCSGQLAAYPLSGGRPDQLTSSRDAGTFLGAWHLPSGVYAEAAACGQTWLEKLNQKDGTATTLTIPGAANAGTVQPLGTDGDQMPLLLAGGCDGHFPYSFVDWYNPGANTATTVIGGPAGGGFVTHALLFRAG